MKISDERLRRCAGGEIFLDAAEQEDASRELLAARKVVKTARCCNGGDELFNAIADYDDAVDEPPGEPT